MRNIFKSSLAATIFIVSAFLLLNAMDISANNLEVNNSFETPEFAYPQTVMDNAEVALEQAQKDKNGIKLVQAVMQMTIANNKISVEKATEMLIRTDELAESQPADIKALLYSIEADVYLCLYRDDMWKYNNRELPTDSFPDNPQEWSKDLYAKKISELVGKVLSDKKILQSKSPADFNELLAQNNDNLTLFYPTLYDFLAYRSIKQLATFCKDDIIPFNIADCEPTISQSVIAQMKAIATELIAIHKADNNDAALSIAAINWLNNCVDSKMRPGLMLDAYAEMIDSPYSSELLASLVLYVGDATDDENYIMSVREYYNLCKAQIEKFPDYFRISVIKNLLSVISMKQATYEVNPTYMSNETVTAKVVMNNLTEAYLHIYKVSDKYDDLLTRKLTDYIDYFRTEKVTAGGELPFSKTVNVDLGRFDYGRYAIEISNNETPDPDYFKQRGRKTFAVSDLKEFIRSGVSAKEGKIKSEMCRVYVVDAKTGKPLENAMIKCSKEIYKTNSSGYMEMPEADSDKKFVVEYGRDKLYVNRHYGGYRQLNEEESGIHVSILSDLALYHPGDTVNFSAIAYKIGKNTNELLKNKQLKFVLQDPNWEDVETIELTTDNDGRTAGKFVLAKDGLRGRYGISVENPDYDENEEVMDFYISSIYFKVEEYKAPTFYVETDKIDDNYVVGDTIKIGGVVKTYSGMPVANAKIDYKIEYNSWWRWISGPGAEYKGNIATDEKGYFKIELPTDNLKNTRYAVGKYIVSLTATSESGESQEAPVSMFSIGEDYTINAAVNDLICADSGKIEMSVDVQNIVGVNVEKELMYHIVNLEDTTIQIKGGFVSPKFTLDADKIPSGRYKVNFELSSDSTVKAENQFIVYRSTDKRPPYKAVIWTPQTSYYAENGAKEVNVKIGSGYEDSKVLCVVSNGEGIISERWIEVDGKNINLKVPAPQKYGKVWVELCNTRDNKTVSTEITVFPADDKKQLKITTLSFRDKLIPGGTERWTFAFDLDGEKTPFIPVMATMSDKALNHIIPFEWDKNQFDRYYLQKLFDIETNRKFGAAGLMHLNQELYPEKAIDQPILYTYGMSMLGERDFDGIYGMNYRASSNDMVLYNTPSSASCDEIYMAVESELCNEEMIMKSVGSVAMEEVEEVEKKISFRATECPTAFFYPNLSTDEEGVVEVTFDVPDFNTTWQFQILGYTPDLKSTCLVKNVIANKPIMVKSNLPRFLRTGDKARICAMIFNNSDTLKSVEGRIEIFDPLTDKVLKIAQIDAVELDASGSKQIYIDYEVPTEYAFIGFRVYAQSDEFTDGEQSLISILPSSSPVVETMPFYLNDKSNKVELVIPEIKTDANLTLQYSDNPVWYCVTALPSLTTASSESLFSQLYSFFGNSVAQGLLNKYPQAGEAIAKWSADTDEASGNPLLSALSRNDDLKIVELENSTWVNDAASETMRMGQLSRLLNKEEVANTVNTQIRELLARQEFTGGWSWCPGGKSSLFATSSVLLHLAMLSDMGCLDGSQEISSAVTKAVEYCDKECLEASNKKLLDKSQMLHYLYIRSFFDIDVKNDFAKLKSETIKKIRNSWKNFEVYDLATAAILLNREKFDMEARSMLEALRQQAVTSPERGMYYDNLKSSWSSWDALITTTQVLEAFNEILPDAPSVDMLRQWLLIQRQGQDWGAQRYTSEVIYAILSTGSDWTSDYEPARIVAGGNELNPTREDDLTGAFTMRLSAENLKAHDVVSIEKNGNHPAWGGLLMQYVAPMTEVKSHSVDDLSIEKAVYVLNQKGSGNQPVKADSLEVGQRVRVVLTINCKRDLDYVAITDERSACLEPVKQLSGYNYEDGVWAYRESRNSNTNFFIDFLSKGVHMLTYDCFVSQQGVYSIGIATAQSQYAPTISAHSAGDRMIVK